MSEFPDLDATDQRILGSLLEKQSTVPASYPLTANALRTACNQTSNRDPVVDLDQQTIEQAARSLKERELLRTVWSGAGQRTLKYHQRLEEALELEPDERAIITVLLLRGAQAPGELRTRTERLHPFADRTDVEACLHRMAAREPALVRKLPRRPGQQDHRWIHLLGPVPGNDDPVVAEPPVDRETVIADGADARDEKIRASYDAVATDYADELTGELPSLPLETWLLDRILADTAGRPVVEAGCGPGHVTAYLAAGGATATGIDLSPEMVAEARRRYPDGDYQVGDLRTLMRPPSSSGWAAVLAWYSLIHLAASELGEAVAALARPLDPGGTLVLAVHAGAEVRHVDEWFGHQVDLDVVLHEADAILRAVEAAGLVDIEWYLRGPHSARGETTQRLYVIGRRAV